MGAALQHELVETICRAALEPDAWSEVVALMGRRFPSAAQALYFLHVEPRRVQPVSLAGIGDGWLRSFDTWYFAPDNPWLRVSPALHRPGVVRTNERLDRFLRSRGALYRSSYYNEWMRPQGFKHTIGNTLLAEAGVVANFTLLREADRAGFSAAEVRAFEALSPHMTRSLQMAVRLQCLEASPAGLAALDAMPQAVAVVDAQRRVAYANPAMESLLRRGRGLALRQQALTAAQPGWQSALAAHLTAALSATAAATTASKPPAATALPGRSAGAAGATQSTAAASAAGHGPLLLPDGNGGALTLHAMPLAGSMSRWLPWRPLLLLVATEPAQPPLAASVSRQCGCTASEGRLAELLAAGHGLRDAAERLGITYGSARACLKIVFDKLGVHTQAQLVARLLRGTGAGRAAAGADALPGSP